MAGDGTPGRVLTILAAVGVMGALVYFVGEQVRPRGGDAPAGHGAIPPPPEAEPLVRTTFATATTPPTRHGNRERSLTEYYERRAYPGAPPVIPHPVREELMKDPRACNACHERGGWVAKFGAYAPVTPHPEYESCTQCHVSVETAADFQTAEWRSVRPPEIHQTAMPGSPPAIPHSLHMRSNCLACHAGPAAPAEIRTSHPERINCVQCHVARETDDGFVRSFGSANPATGGTQ